MPTLVEQINYVEREIKWIKSSNDKNKIIICRLNWLMRRKDELHNQLANSYMQYHPYSNKCL